jgi:osmotically-inducible protein OsmY
MKRKFGFFLITALSSGLLLAQDADNTRVNKQDRDASQPTADQAKNARSDREIMKDIRKSIVDDKSLSTYAHNVKVISQHGKVTLRGPVRSDEERKAIEAKARDAAGPGNVTNDLSVKGDTASR